MEYGGYPLVILPIGKGKILTILGMVRTSSKLNQQTPKSSQRFHGTASGIPTAVAHSLRMRTAPTRAEQQAEIYKFCKRMQIYANLNTHTDVYI